MFQDTIADDPTARQRSPADPPPRAARLSRDLVGALLALAALLVAVWVAA
jgi:hypothetical protein